MLLGGTNLTRHLVQQQAIWDLAVTRFTSSAVLQACITISTEVSPNEVISVIVYLKLLSYYFKDFNNLFSTIF